MNPAEFVLKESGIVTGWGCGECGVFYSIKHHAEPLRLAERCCDYRCRECKKPAPKGWTICEMCRSEKDARKEAEAYEKAPKLTLAEYAAKHPDGMVTNGEDFWSLDELPAHDWSGEQLWFTEPLVGIKLDAHYILENALDDHHEDAIERVCVGELQNALDAWCKENPVTSWVRSEFAVHPDDMARLREEAKAEEDS